MTVAKTVIRSFRTTQYAKEPPARAERQRNPGEQRRMGERQEDEPCGGRNDQVGSACGPLILAGDGKDGACKEDEYGANPADGRGDVSAVNVSLRRPGAIVTACRIALNGGL